MGRSRVRLPVPLVLLVLLVAGLAISRVGGAGSRYPRNEPLPRFDGAGIEIPAAAGTLLSWGMSLPGDPGGEIVPEAIEPVSVQGVAIPAGSTTRSYSASRRPVRSESSWQGSNRLAVRSRMGCTSSRYATRTSCPPSFSGGSCRARERS